MSFGEGILTYPDLFPARPAGEAWGDRSVLLDLIGGPYLISGLGDLQARRIRADYGPLILETAIEPSVRLSVFRAVAADFQRPPADQELYRVDIDHAPQWVRLACHEFLGRIDWAPEPRAAVWTPAEDDEAFDRAFANVFRTVVAYTLLGSGGALIHSAGLLDGQVAMLFVGHSGAGKSTLSKLAHEAGLEVLSDDLNALCLVDGEILLEKLPFAGEFRTEGPFGRFPLVGVFRLRKGNRFETRPVGTAESLAFLASCCPFVNTDPYRGEALLTNLESLVRRIHLQELTFPLAGGFWEQLRSERAA